MAHETILLNNYSDDSQIKQYISDILMPRVFHDIPLNVLNTGSLSIINEYMSQAIEQLAFTASFYHNESFITKAVLADSIYAEAAIFNIGYSYATPSSCNFLLELKLEDIYNNAVPNPDGRTKDFVLDKNTKFNLSNGSVYSLDYDILIQFQDEKTSEVTATIPAWNVQYTNMDQQNSVATNKKPYITYRVTDVWLCLLVQANEYERETHTIVNNMTNSLPNPDAVIKCNNHIAGFDIKYIDGSGNEQYIPPDHVLPIHEHVKDTKPYVHYIMDNPQTIRFMFQLNGTKFFVPQVNSSFEITIYTCHGEAANFTAFKNDEQPKVITSSNRYTNNANVMKAAFVISGSLGGTNIGTIETTRRETIEAYNTVNVLSSDHDIDEYFKTFYFKNVLYPFFFKRRDDPWGRIWSGYMALKDEDDYVFRTNTLHCKIPYRVLYNNNDNTVTSNEIIIPPGLVWVYGNENRFTVVPYTGGDGVTIETADTKSNINEKFVFSNPFGIRIQKQPFAIGYFNPWINSYFTATKIPTVNTQSQFEAVINDLSYLYHATPLATQIVRTYKDNFYKLSMHISPTIPAWVDGTDLVRYVRQNAAAPTFVEMMWNYFNKPIDMFAPSIPMIPIREGNGYIPFNPETTYFCVRERNRVNDTTWQLSDMWIEDMSEPTMKQIFIPISGAVTMLYGEDDIWGDKGLWNGYEITAAGNTDIGIYPALTNDHKLHFERIASQNYYELRISDDAELGHITKVVVGEAVETDLTKYGIQNLTKIGKSYAPSTYINIYFSNGTRESFTISNAATIYSPYTFEQEEEGIYVAYLDNVGADGVVLYADMKPTPESGAIEYYRIPFSNIPKNKALFNVSNKLLPMDQNNMRIILHAMMNGSETGYVEMQPVRKEEDGSYLFETCMYPINEFVDIDNRIKIASTDNGGGNWISNTPGSVVNVDASTPEFKVSILIRSKDELRDSPISIGDIYTGFRVVDQYVLDDVSLIQELKEMRSVVEWGESSQPTPEQVNNYSDFLGLYEWNGSIPGNFRNIEQYAQSRINSETDITYPDISAIAKYTSIEYKMCLNQYKSCVSDVIPYTLNEIDDVLRSIVNSETEGDDIDWKYVHDVISVYQTTINDAFSSTNVNGGLEIQLVPMVSSTLMTSDRFTSFVSSFTQVHKAIEPVIMKRLEGNNYLDCKLLATYGLPHTYINENTRQYWPDLNIQIEFDVKLYNGALATNTLNELRLIIKSYFNRLTSIHTPTDATSIDTNIYVSHIIQQMEQHPNVAYMKFVGWYTNEKGVLGGNYMDANTQSIVQKYNKIEDFHKSNGVSELESYTPELFVLDDANIVLNVL